MLMYFSISSNFCCAIFFARPSCLIASFKEMLYSYAICKFVTLDLDLDWIYCVKLICNLYISFVGLLGNSKSNFLISFRGFYDSSSSMNKISRVMINLVLPYTTICTVSPTCIPSPICAGFSFDGFSTLILNFSNTVFTSCSFSKIESILFSAFSHISDSWSLIVVATSWTTFFVEDV